MISLWSAVNPGVWVTRGPSEGGTFTISGTANVDNSTSMSHQFGSALGFLTFLTHIRPYAFLELAVGVLGLLRNYDDQIASIHVPGIQQSSERYGVDSEGDRKLY